MALGASHLMSGVPNAYPVHVNSPLEVQSARGVVSAPHPIAINLGLTPNEVMGPIRTEADRLWIESHAKTQQEKHEEEHGKKEWVEPTATPAKYVLPNANMLPSMPLDRAYLRPLQQPLFDTEWFVPGKGIKSLPFFKNPMDWGGDVRHTYEYLNEAKSKHDTNLNQSGMLDYPREFSLLGVAVKFDPKADENDVRALLSNGANIAIKLGSNRDYLNVPLEMVAVSKAVAEYRKRDEIRFHKENQVGQCLVGAPPNPHYQAGEMPTFGAARGATEEKEENEDLIEMAARLLEKAIGTTFYKMNLGRSALKIKPGEPFSVTLSWKKAPPVMRPVKIITELIGLLWMPL